MLESIKTVLKRNTFMLKLIFKYEPLYLVSYMILQISMVIANVMGTVLLPKVVIDTVEQSSSIEKTIIFGAIVIVVNIVLTVINAFYEECYTLKVKEKISLKMQMRVFKQAVGLDLISYDDPNFYNDLVWATKNSDSKVFEVLNTTARLVQLLVGATTLVAIISLIEPVGLLVVGVSCVLNFVLNVSISKKEFEREKQLKPLERKAKYIGSIFYLPDYAKEVRLSNIQEVLIREYEANSIRMKKVVGEYGKTCFRSKTIQEYVGTTFALDTIYILFLIYSALIKKSISLGTITALLNSVWKFKSYVNDLGRILSEYNKHSLFIGKLMSFLETIPTISDGNQPLDEKDGSGKIEIENVTFYYNTQQDKKVLDNINLEINKGEKIAIVGRNGSGKSTLVKLLLRLYEVNEGTIRYNGVDIREYNKKEYRQQYGVTFQDYQLYAAYLYENIIMGKKDETSEETILNAIKKSDFINKYNQLPNGLQTALLKEFNKEGVILSGGEGQKVGIARALVKEKPIIILDEPSSSLDPISEYKLNNHVLNEMKEETVIFISHRLTITTRVDKIVVLEGGKIVEIGNHCELMKLDGVYAKMFNTQAEKYREVN